MKTLIIKIEIQTINFYLMQRAQGAEVAEALSIPMEEKFQNAGFMEKPTEFALYLIDIIKSNTAFKKCRQCMIVLDNSYILSKDFTHNKTYGTQLEALAEIEMEALVNGNVSDYVLLTHSYGNRVFLEGYYKSFLYVLPKKFLNGFLRSFQKSGIALKSVVALSTAYNDFANSLKVKAETGYTAFINFGKYKTLLSIFEEKEFVYEGSFTSVYLDIIHVIEEDLALSQEDAEKLFFENGLSDTGKLPEAVREKIRLLLGAAVIEVSRSASIAASVERKDLNQVIITGDFTAFPGFKTYFTDAFGGESKVLSEYEDVSYLQFVRQTKLNFLLPIRKNIQKKKRLNMIFILLVLLTLTTFAVKPLSYYYAVKLRDAAVEDYQRAGYAQIRQRIEMESKLGRELQSLKKDEEVITAAKSSAAGQIVKMLDAFANGAQLQSYEYIEATGIFNVIFTVASLDDFMAVKNRIISANVFDIAIPFSYTEGEEIVCQVWLKPNEQAADGGK